MEPNTQHDTTQLHENPLYRRPSLWRRLGLVAAGLAFAVPAVGLATYGIAGASDGTDDDTLEEIGACGDWTPEDIAENNEEQDALAAFLDERGIAHTNEPDELGLRTVEWDEEDEAANDAVDEFYAARYPLSPEELAAATDQEDALAAYLDEHGVRYTREAGADGVSYVVWDEDDEAAGEAVGAFYAERYPLPPDDLSAFNAQEDELAAFLDSRGIPYTREPDTDGVSYIVWDDEDAAANAAVDEFYESRDDSATCVGMIEISAH